MILCCLNKCILIFVIFSRALRLEDLFKAKAQLIKSISGAKRRRKKKYDYDKLEHVFKMEIVMQNRLLQKIQIKNGILSNQVKRLMHEIRIRRIATEESGPVDLQQLQLENENLFNDLQRRNIEVVQLRKTVNDSRRKLFGVQEMFSKEHKRQGQMKKNLDKLAKDILALKLEVDRTEKRFRKESIKLDKLKDVGSKYQVPSLDDYIDLKLELERQKEEEKKEERRVYLEQLRLAVDKQKVMRQRSRSAVGMRREIQRPAFEKGHLVRGKTFNLEFEVRNAEN